MKKIGIGYEEYKRFIDDDMYYIDKTMLISDIVEKGGEVTLFARPRRFGKTLAMSMLCTFFELEYDYNGNVIDKRRYFEGKKIMNAGDKILSMMGKYPVIKLSLKSAKQRDYLTSFKKLREDIINEYKRHSYLWENNILPEDERQQLKKLTVPAEDKELKVAVDINAEIARYSTAFKTLSYALKKYHNQNVIILLDEYDVPLENAYYEGFYDEMAGFICSLFESALKTNDALERAVVTGCLRISKESIFTGLNHLTINSVLDDTFAEGFGFTEEETEKMLIDYGLEEKFPEVRKWYDGYLFGNTEIFNPWSVINYVSEECFPKAFWQSTGSNDIIGEIVSSADEDIVKSLYRLLNGETVISYVDTSVIYPKVQSDPYSIYSFLLVTGYLKLVSVVPPLGEGALCEVALPNQEIAFVYKKEILDKLSVFIPQSMSIAIQKAIYSGNADSLQKQMRQLLLQSVSSFDTSHEDFYHGLLLGLCAMMDNRYTISSNRESGEGRFDIQLMPKTNNLPGILMEVKWTKSAERQALEKLAQSAIRQINEKHYETELRTHGVKQILKYGAAFSGKNVEICME